MVGNTLSESIIRTKMHRPPVGPDFVSRPRLLERLEKHRQRPLTLVTAPAGYGKSMLMSHWLETCDCPSGWVSLDKNDNHLPLFLGYFLSAVQIIFPDAGRKTLAMVNASSPPPVSVLAGSLLNELARIEQPFMLVLDDFHHIQDESVHELLIQLLSHLPQSLHLVLVGRRDPALPIFALRAKGQVTEIRTQELRFTKAEMAEYLERFAGIQINPSTAGALEEKIEGWVTGLRLAALSMRHRGDLDPSLLEPQVDAQYVMEYLFNEVFSRQPPEFSQYLLGTAVLDRFCGPLCEAVCVPGAEPFTCETGGWEFVAWLKKENLFLISLDAENRWFRYHHLFRKLLVNQLTRRCSAEEIKALHAQAGAWFAENDLLEEALQHAMAAGKTETAGSLVARFSHKLMNNQQWVRLERCLHLLPRDQVERDPALLVLEAWLQHIRHNFSGVAACVERIEALNAASPPDTLVNVKHVQGLFDAMKGALHYLAAEGENAITSFQRALMHIPVHHKRGQLLGHTGYILAYQMVGDFETGFSIYQKAMERHIDRDNNYHAMYLGKLGLVHWIDADLTALQQTAESILDLAKDAPLSPISPYYSRYFMGIIHYHRNELRYAEEKLSEVVKAHYTASPINFAHSAFALALTCQARGKPGQAREICKAVVADSIETNNADMLQIARAFEAELALRQGRLAEAFRWAESYQVKPFLPTFRFYMPQLTAIKIMLAQDTTAGRRQAADLLDQLHDFLTSIHNIRFQIDVLSLQALYHESGGEKAVAIEKLTEALNLAEPGGFIRLFVDLGPQMADLLKRLVRQNVALDYIGRILAAFSDQEHRTAPDPTDHTSPPSDHSMPKAPPQAISQPLAELLTHRELEISNLLVQRLSNKEIAAKLLISPETVKKHLNNIYGKLNVRSRQQAVEKAQALGILTR